MKIKLLFILLTSFIIGCSSPTAPEPDTKIIVNVTGWQYEMNSIFILDTQVNFKRLEYDFTVSNLTNHNIAEVRIIFKYVSIHPDDEHLVITETIKNLSAHAKVNYSRDWYVPDDVETFEYTGYEIIN